MNNIETYRFILQFHNIENNIGGWSVKTIFKRYLKHDIRTTLMRFLAWVYRKVQNPTVTYAYVIYTNIYMYFKNLGIKNPYEVALEANLGQVLDKFPSD